MPGFLGGLAGGLANSLEKAGNDYTKEQKDKATEERQVARIEALRQDKRAEDLFSQNPDINEMYQTELLNSKGEVIAQLPPSQMKLAQEHNKRREESFKSTAAQNAQKAKEAEIGSSDADAYLKYKAGGGTDTSAIWEKKQENILGLADYAAKEKIQSQYAGSGSAKAAKDPDWYTSVEKGSFGKGYTQDSLDSAFAAVTANTGKTYKSGNFTNKNLKDLVVGAAEGNASYKMALRKMFPHLVPIVSVGTTDEVASAVGKMQ